MPCVVGRRMADVTFIDYDMLFLSCHSTFPELQRRNACMLPEEPCKKGRIGKMQFVRYLGDALTGGTQLKLGFTHQEVGQPKMECLIGSHFYGSHQVLV